MTEQKPNCSTCPHNEEQDNVEMGEWVTCRVCMGKVLTWSSMEHTRIYGCLSHPGAREWMMRDVISYLEQYLIDENTQAGFIGVDLAKSRMANEVIALIRGKE